MFPYCNIHKYTWTSVYGKSYRRIGNFLKEKR